MPKFPNKGELLTFIVVGALLSIAFCLVYGYTNYVAAQSPHQYQFYFDWELKLPFVAPMILVYFSLNILMLSPLFFLNSEEIVKLGWGIFFCLLVGGFAFYFFPASIHFIRTEVVGFWSPIYRALYEVDQPFNTLPSLHIAFSCIIVRVISLKAQPEMKIFFWIWFSLIAVSVLLTHQHHVLDIAAGIVVSELSFRLFFKARVKASFEISR